MPFSYKKPTTKKETCLETSSTGKWEWDDLIRDDLKIVWSEIKTKGIKVLVGNIYVPTNNEEQWHTLDKFLENLKNETIILLADFKIL